MNVLRKQLCYLVAHIVFQTCIELPARLTGETSVDRTHQAIFANEECRGPGIQVFGLWNLLVQLAWFSSDQVGVFNAIALNERSGSREALYLFCRFEVEGDNLKSQTVILLVELFEERGFVVAVRAPTFRLC